MLQIWIVRDSLNLGARQRPSPRYPGEGLYLFVIYEAAARMRSFQYVFRTCPLGHVYTQVLTFRQGPGSPDDGIERTYTLIVQDSHDASTCSQVTRHSVDGSSGTDMGAPFGE